jgi:chromosome partitioning protein
MAVVISMINLKGGVGKTQLTVSLGEFLVREFGKKVLVIDLDPQTNATVMLIGDRRWKELNERGRTLFQLFKDKIDRTSKFCIEDSIVSPTSNVDGGLEDLHLLPSSLDLIEIQDRIPSISQDQFGVVSPATVLESAVRNIIHDYDFVLIDCPPNLGIITLNGLYISDYYLIPTKADYISTYGIPQIISRVHEFNRASGKNVQPLGIVITMYSGYQKNLHETVIDLLKREENYPKVFVNKIPLRQKIAETAYYDDTTYTLKQKYGEAYKHLYDLTREIMAEVSEG